jgi:hypothetical protein
VQTRHIQWLGIVSIAEGREDLLPQSTLRGDTVKYVLLIYQAKDYNPAVLTPEDYKVVAEGYGAINSTPNVRPGLPLGITKDAITVRVTDGETTTTPGTYLESVGGSVGGYYEFEADSDEEAIQLAARIPAARQGGAVEIRPSKVYW